MTNTTQALEVVSLEQLDVVTGGGIGSQIGGMFGAEGAKWGGVADNIMGMFGIGGAGGGGGGGGGAPAGGQPTAG